MLAATRGDLVMLKQYAVKPHEVFEKQDAIADLTPRTTRTESGGLDTSRFY